MAKRAPKWIREIVTTVQDCMEPTGPMAPLAFRISKDQEGYLLCVYPRINELLYGKQDGRLVVPGFRLNICRLMNIFDDMPAVEWETPTDYSGRFDGPCMAMSGLVNDKELELLVFDQPPPGAKVGLLVDWQKGEARPCKRSQ